MDATTFSDLTTAISTGLATVQTNAMSILAVIVPVAIGIFGVVYVVKHARSWFSSLTGR